MTRKDNVYIRVYGSNGGETGKAIRWVLNTNKYPDITPSQISQWFPFSQVTQIHGDYIMAAEWVLKTKDLLDIISEANHADTNSTGTSELDGHLEF